MGTLFQTLRLHHLLHSALLLAAMGALLGVVGWLIAGAVGVVWAVVLALLLSFMTPAIPPELVMRLQGGCPLEPFEAPLLHRLAREIAARAGLPRPPALYLIPSPLPNAVTSGERAGYAIGLTEGLLARLDVREAAAVMAHETAHLLNGDLRTMASAALLGRLTSLLSFVGMALLLLYLPALLLGALAIPWWLPWLLLFAPHLSGLLQLALSRTREFDADLEAARLTGDPLGLASALERLEAPSLWRFGFQRRYREGDAPWLRTHPATDERIARLLALEEERRRGVRRFTPLDNL